MRATGRQDGRWANRRRAVRFRALCRVDYESRGRKSLGFTADVSLRGLFINKAKRLAEGDEVVCHVSLTKYDPPIAVECVVRRITDEGAALELAEGQPQAIDRIRQFLDAGPVSQLAQMVEKGMPTAERLAQLAGYYLETDRLHEAFSVYRRALAKFRTKLHLYDDYAVLLLEHLVATDQRTGPLVVELEQVLERGRKAGGSPALQAVAVDLEALRSGKMVPQGAADAADGDEAENDISWNERTVLDAAVHAQLLEELTTSPNEATPSGTTDSDRPWSERTVSDVVVRSRFHFFVDKLLAELIGMRVSGRALLQRISRERRHNPQRFFAVVSVSLLLLSLLFYAAVGGESNDAADVESTTESISTDGRSNGEPSPEADEPSSETDEPSSADESAEVATDTPRAPTDLPSAATTTRSGADTGSEPAARPTAKPATKRIKSGPRRPPPSHKPRRPPAKKKSIDSLFEGVE